jgi:glutaredoxin
MAIIAWTQKVVPNPTKAFIVTTSSVAVSTLTSAFLFYATSIVSSDSAQASTAVAGQVIAAAEASGRELEEVAVNMPPAIKKKSSERALLVAERLKNLDAKMYGAYWCSHCNNQKQVLGIEGSKMFRYVECDKEGFNSEAKLCRSKNVPGYPTWEIKGQFYPGEKELGELEKILTEAEKSN